MLLEVVDDLGFVHGNRFVDLRIDDALPQDPFLHQLQPGLVLEALAAESPLQLLVRFEIVLLLDVLDGHLELFADVEVLFLGQLEQERVRDHGVQELGLELLDGLLLRVALELGLDLAHPLVVFLFVFGQGDDIVIDDGHDLFDDLLGGGRGGAGDQQDQEQAVSFFIPHDSILW